MIAAALAIPATSPFRRFVDLWNGSEAAHRATRWESPALPILIGHGPLGFRHRPGNARRLPAVRHRRRRDRQPHIVRGRRRRLMLSNGRMDQARPVGHPGKMSRSFFGVYSIGSRQGGEAQILLHGTTIHGIQLQGSAERAGGARRLFLSPVGCRRSAFRRAVPVRPAFPHRHHRPRRRHARLLCDAWAALDLLQSIPSGRNCPRSAAIQFPGAALEAFQSWSAMPAHA